MKIEIVETGVSTENGTGGSEEQNPAAAGEKVLRAWHVDDSKNFRELLASFLALHPGIKCVRSLPSAETALDALTSEEPPDIILLDVRMDGMSGLDAIAPIKRLAPQTAVLMLTTLYGPADKARAIQSGASDLLLKTFRVEEIVDRARQAHEKLIQTSRNELGKLNKSLLPNLTTEKAGTAPSRSPLSALHESLSYQSERQPTGSTVLCRFVDGIRQVWMTWVPRWRRRQSPMVSS